MDGNFNGDSVLRSPMLQPPTSSRVAVPKRASRGPTDSRDARMRDAISGGSSVDVICVVSMTAVPAVGSKSTVAPSWRSPPRPQGTEFIHASVDFGQLPTHAFCTVQPDRFSDAD